MGLLHIQISLQAQFSLENRDWQVTPVMDGAAIMDGAGWVYLR